MFEKTYHHLIYGIYDVKHLVPGDVAVIIKVVQFKGPCVEKHVKVLRGGPTSMICDITNSSKAIYKKTEVWTGNLKLPVHIAENGGGDILCLVIRIWKWKIITN